jgi:hypothetical protein
VIAIDPLEARAWCETLAHGLERELIRRDGAPYLERYFLAGWSPLRPARGPGVFLHHFLASDRGDLVHSHPWKLSISLILVGGYREERRDPDTGALIVRDFFPGSINVLAADDLHRLELLEADAWTLFIAGAGSRAWRFLPRADLATAARSIAGSGLDPP